MRENLAGLAHDALTLAELQVQLLTVDLRDARRGAGSAVAQLLVGAVLALGCVPVLLTAAAHGLVEGLNWPWWAAYATAGAVAAVVAGALLWTGWKRVMRAVATIQRSRAEFTETLRWLKSTLKDGRRQRATPLPPEHRHSRF